MRRNYVYICLLVIAIFAVIGGIFYCLKKGYSVQEAKVTNQVQNMSENETTVATASREEKVSPNAKFALKKCYDKCNHFNYDEVELPTELVNLTEQEVEDFYEDWEVEDFSESQLVLCKKIEGYCNEHFVVKLDSDMVAIYKVGTLGELNLYKSTDISKDYLPEEDVEKLEEGIPIFGEGKLGMVLEDYE